MAEIAAFLRAGTNVVGTSFVWLVAPDRRRVAARTPRPGLRRRRSTLYINGVDPGFSGDTLVYAALSVSGRHCDHRAGRSLTTAPTTTRSSPASASASGRDPGHTPILFPRRALVHVGAQGTRPGRPARRRNSTQVRERHEGVGRRRADRLHHDARRTGQGRGHPIRHRRIPRRCAGHHDGARQPASPGSPHQAVCSAGEGRPGDAHRVQVDEDPGVGVNAHVRTAIADPISERRDRHGSPR